MILLESQAAIRIDLPCNADASDGPSYGALQFAISILTARDPSADRSADRC